MGQFEWRVMPFGSKVAPSTFQAIMSSAFFDMLGALQHLLKQKASFLLTAAHSSAVQALKDRLIHYTKLSLPDLTKPFILRTVASGVAIKAMLEQDGKPLGFLSKRLSDAEMRYQCTIRSFSQSWMPSNVGGIFSLQQSISILCTNQVEPTGSRMHYLAGPVYEQDPQRASSKVLSVSSLPPTAPQQSCISASNPPEPVVRASLLFVRAKVGRRPGLQIESNTNSGPSYESPSPLLHDNVQKSPQSSLSDPEMQGVADEAWKAALQRCSEFSAACKRASLSRCLYRILGAPN
ncbi:hypothetical protein Esti_000613 [Eimeria stiedai]